MWCVLKNFYKDYIQMNEDIKIYTTKFCKFCKLVQEFFDKHGKKYSVIDITNSPAEQNYVKLRSGQFSVPVTIKGSKVVIGFAVSQLKELL